MKFIKLEMNAENFRKDCALPPTETYHSSLGFTLSVPEWEAAVTGCVLSLITLVTIVGNILVILSVFKHKPLRNAQNFFIVSLAVADLTVALFVLPFNIVYTILGRWIFGSFFCKFWLTCDILCCTASILNLCAIALDRYWAITDPIDYAQKRNLNWVLKIIAGVWTLSAIISSPPLAGWNNWPEMFDAETPCRLTDEQGYVVYSSLGSFYIPLFIMAVVYVEIYVATRRRLRRRSRAAKMSMVRLKQMQTEPKSPSYDAVSVSTETSTKVQEPEVLKKHNGKSERSVEEDSVTDSHDTASSTTDKTRTSTSEGNIKDLQKQSSFTTQEDYPVYQFIEDRHRISLSKERRAARTMGVIMGAFVFCWLPFFLMYVIEPFCVICCPSMKLVNFMTWLGYANSAINPFIYTIFNMDFRKAFRKLLHLN